MNTAPTYPTGLKLCLGTWFFKLVVGTDPGGLPADFFTHAASALLVCDELLCDSQAFDSEMDFAGPPGAPGSWLSSCLFRDLRTAGVLRPVPYASILAALIEVCRTGGLSGRLQEVMEQERAALASDSQRAQRPPHALLSQTNALFLLGLSAGGLLPYGWKDGHLAPSKVASLPLASVEASTPLEVAEAELPHLQVMQSPSVLQAVDPEGYRNFQRNLARERLPLYLWMYGDARWDREKYNAFRQGPDFLRGDRALDRAREKDARSALERLLLLREETASERSLLQQHLDLAAQERRTPTDLRKDALELEQHYRNLLPTRQRFIVSATSLSLGLATGVGSFVIPALGIPGLIVSVAGAIGLVRRHRQERVAHDNAPLGWIYSRVSEVGIRR